jgi:protein TonB
LIDIDENIDIKVEPPKPKIQINKPKELVNLKIEKNDKKIKEDIFKNSEVVDKDSIIDVTEIDTSDIENPEVEVDYKFVEQVPVFPGCKGNKEQLKKCMNEKIRRLVAKNFNTEIAQDLGLSGERVRIFTQFTIDKDGKITAIKTRSKYKDLEKEAEKVIKTFPKMKPGKQRGRPVKVTYTLPIIFNVEED